MNRGVHPFQDETQDCAVETTLDSIFMRRSIRSFEDRPVEEWKKRILFQAAVAAPSAHGRSPWKFSQIADPELITKIVTGFPWFSPAALAGLNILVLGEPAKCVNEEYWAVDCAAATQNMLLAAQSLGLGAVWLGIAPVQGNIANFCSIVKIPDGLIPFSMIAIGYPKEGSRKHERRSIDPEKFMIRIP